MKFTLERAFIFSLVISLVYYVVKHRNLIDDLFRIPDRDHLELKKVKEKHAKSKPIYCPHTKVPDPGHGVWHVLYDKSVDPHLSEKDKKWYDLNWMTSGDTCDDMYFYDVDQSTQNLKKEKAIMLLDSACKSTCEQHGWAKHDRKCELDHDRIETGTKARKMVIQLSM